MVALSMIYTIIIEKILEVKVIQFVSCEWRLLPENLVSLSETAHDHVCCKEKLQSQPSEATLRKKYSFLRN